MSQNHTFRLQTGWYAPTDTGTANYWVNSSGALFTTNANGSGYFVPTLFPAQATGSRAAMSSGVGVFSNGVAGGNFTGIFIGSTGFNPSQYPVVLGNPTYWINGIGPNNELLAIPAYTRTS